MSRWGNPTAPKFWAGPKNWSPWNQVRSYKCWGHELAWPNAVGGALPRETGQCAPARALFRQAGRNSHQQHARST